MIKDPLPKKILETSSLSSLVSVDRAIAEIRRGAPVLVTGTGVMPLLVLAIETLNDDSLALLKQFSVSPIRLFITGRRAQALGLLSSAPKGSCAEIKGDDGTAMTASALSVFCDPESEGAFPSSGIRAVLQPATETSSGAIALVKAARLLPAVAGVRIEDLISSHSVAHWAQERNILTVQASAILTYQRMAAQSLRMVSEAHVPLEGTQNVRLVMFRPVDGGIEHLAIVIGNPDPREPVLLRLHSECFTGDLLGSLRCDCGDQLRGAIATMGKEGSGIVLYLSQEGRGIGLANKLRAYRLQDKGFDTMDANGQLGFDDDERDFLPAAEMLRLLGITSVRLMTNNPWKVDALKSHGVQVTERVPHIFASNTHNASYLKTKEIKGGHLF